MDKLFLKKAIIDQFREILTGQMVEQEEAMAEAQKEANSHKGAMESRYDSFKEEAQDKKNAHAKHLYSLMQLQSQLNSIKLKICDEIEQGAIVETDVLNFFVIASISSDTIKYDNKEYRPISMLSPIGAQLRGKKKGDKIRMPNGKLLTLADVY